MLVPPKGEAAEAQRVITQTQTTLRKRRAKYDFEAPDKYDAADQEMEVMKAKIQAAPASSASGRRMVKEKKARSNAIFLLEDSF